MGCFKMKKRLLIILLFLLSRNKVYALETSAESACMIIADTGTVIYDKNSQEKLPMASTTKIMTAILALEKSNPTDVVTVSSNAAAQEGSSIYIENGDKIYMNDLLYGLMLNSGNDAAVAIAEYVSGNTNNFANEMNSLAKKIGAYNTSFQNPNGLDDNEHYTTAYDLALITAYAMKNPDFRNIVSTKEKNCTLQNGNILYFSNHNKLLKMYDGTTGVKTGYTKKSGRCLVSAANKNGIELIAVTLNAPDDWNDHISMMNYGFSTTKTMLLTSGNEIFKTIYTTNNREIGCLLKDEISLPLHNETLPKNELITHLPKKLEPPLKKGEKIGEADIMINGNLYKKTDILCDRDISIQKGNFSSSFFRIVKRIKKLYLQ